MLPVLQFNFNVINNTNLHLLDIMRCIKNYAESCDQNLFNAPIALIFPCRLNTMDYFEKKVNRASMRGNFSVFLLGKTYLNRHLPKNNFVDDK